MRRRQLVIVLFISVAACTGFSTTAVGSQAETPGTVGWSEVLRLRAARDYFTLRERVESSVDSRGLPTRFALALVQHAFNASTASNATIDALLADGRLPDSLATELRRVQIANHPVTGAAADCRPERAEHVARGARADRRAGE